MKRKLFGSSCLAFIAICVVAGFMAMFAGSVIFNQTQAGAHTAQPTALTVPLHATTPVVLPTTTQEPVQSLDIGVTVDAPISPIAPQATITVAPATQTPLPMITNTPGLPPLGTMSYPLTVTAESAIAGTKVAVFKDSVAATRTEIAQESQAIFMTLTAAAPQPGK